MKKLLLNKQQNSFIVTETYEGLCILLEAFLNFQLRITDYELRTCEMQIFHSYEWEVYPHDVLNS